MDTVWMMVRFGKGFIMHMDPGQWLVTMLLVATLGVMSLQGFGSRSDY